MRRLILIFIITLFCVSPYSSWAQFGTNKVQYETFTWQFYKTRHFDIYYHEGGEYLAKFAGIVCERSLVSIERTLNYSIDKRIAIMVYNTHNQFQQTNVISSSLSEGTGGVTELLKNRVTLPFDGDYEQFRHVIHHELVHAVLNLMFYGGSYQTAVQMRNPVMIPLFMNEGLAEFEGIGGYNTETDMFMRDMALSESLRGLQSLNGYLAYRGGQAFYWYIAEKYGKRKIGEFINRLRTAQSLDAAYKSSFGLNFEDFSEQWVKDMKKIYLPDIGIYEDVKDYATPLTNSQKDLSFYNTSPAISPDATKMAYISAIDREFGIYIKDISNPKSEPELVLKSGRSLDFEELNILTPGISWSPDGKKLAISAKAGGEDALYLVDIKEGDYEKKLFGLKSISWAIWSPDGAHIAFIASENEQSNIYLYATATGKIERLTNDVFTKLHPTWSPDSKKLYFVSDRGDYLEGSYTAKDFEMWNYDHSRRDIYSIEIATQDMERITVEPQYDKTSIAVSPDGKSLFYVSDKNGIGNLYLLNLETRKTEIKTNSLQGIAQLSLARDGSTLLFNSLINGGYDIFQMKFPFDRKTYDSIPVTTFRKRQVLSQLEEKLPEISQPQEQKSLSYGEYELEFSRQQNVKPNTDVMTPPGIASSGGGDYIDTTMSGPFPYRLSFSMDYAFSNFGYNTFWGAQGQQQFLFSDMMGDHQIYVAANLFLDIRNSNLYAAYYYLPEIVDYQVAVYNRLGWSGVNFGGGNILSRFRNTGVNFGAWYPLSTFRRVEFGVSYMNTAQDYPELPTLPGTTIHTIVPEARLVFDNTRPGWWGPADGTRYGLNVIGSPKLGNSGIGFMKITADLRQYFSLFNGYMTTALRGNAGTSFGPNPQRFVLGGVENWIRQVNFNQIPFSSPADFAFMEFGMPLRGWEIGRAIGTNFFVTNAELRFPLFYGVFAGPVPIPLQGVQGTMFFDMGGAWNNGQTFVSARPDENGNLTTRDLLMSAGVGMRTFVLGLPLRVDVAWRNLYWNWSQPLWMFSIGGDW